jgi:hypothetical protein
LAGNQYKVSVVQVKEVQRKLRNRKLLKFELNKTDIEEFQEEQEFEEENTEELILFGEILNEDFESQVEVDEESLSHVAGFCVSAVSKHSYRTSTGCRDCVSRLRVEIIKVHFW